MQLLALRDRHLRVPSSTGSSVISVDRLVEHPLERRPGDLLLPGRAATGGSDSSSRKSARTGAALLGREHLRSSASPATPSIRVTPGHQRGMWCGSAITSQTLCWGGGDRAACGARSASVTRA